MNPAGALFIGDVYLETTALLAAIPAESLDGSALRALHVLAGEERSSPDGYWIMRVGTLSGGTFSVLSETQFPDGFPSTLRRFQFETGLRHAPGEVLAVRLVPNGAPPPISGLSVAPEWGILGSRR
jgi:hypothetical protein